MPSTTLSNATTTAIAKGLKAHLESLGIDVRHTDLLAGIARGLGFSNTQSMRALGRAPCEQEAVPEFSGTPAGYRTRFLIEVLSDEDDIAPINDLDELHYEITSGGSVGLVSHLETTPLNRNELSAEAIRMNSDPDFFFDHEDAMETDGDGTAFSVRALFHRDGETAPIHEATFLVVANDEKDALAKAQVRAKLTISMEKIEGATISLDITRSVKL